MQVVLGVKGTGVMLYGGNVLCEMQEEGYSKWRWSEKRYYIQGQSDAESRLPCLRHKDDKVHKVVFQSQARNR